jgi:hypothetical protein
MVIAEGRDVGDTLQHYRTTGRMENLTARKKETPPKAASLLLRVLGLAFGGRRAARGLKKETLPLPGRWLTSE